MKGRFLCKGHECFGILGGKARLDILTFLKKGDANVTRIARALGCTQPTASHHLDMLYGHGYVTRAKHGKETVYRFNESYPCKGCGHIVL